MSTKTGDEADSIGNIEKFLQQCLEDMEPDRRDSRVLAGRVFCPRWLCGRGCWSAY